MGNCWSYQSNPSYYPHDILAAINYFRAHHVLTPHLVLDMDLCNKALAEANLSAYNDELDPRTYPAYKKLTGEIKWVFDMKDKDNKGIAPCPFAPPMHWYQEICKFKFGDTGKGFQIDGEGNLVAPNFQTLIWRTTRKVGVGVAVTKDKAKIYVVARFDGNYDLSPVSNIKMPINALPALRIEIGEKSVATRAKKTQYELKMLGYKMWCKENLPEEDAEQFSMEEYIKNNPWVKKPPVC